jgi:hypothetical protein
MYDELEEQGYCVTGFAPAFEDGYNTQHFTAGRADCEPITTTCQPRITEPRTRQGITLSGATTRQHTHPMEQISPAPTATAVAAPSMHPAATPSTPSPGDARNTLHCPTHIALCRTKPAPQDVFTIAMLDTGTSSTAASSDCVLYANKGPLPIPKASSLLDCTGNAVGIMVDLQTPQQQPMSDSPQQNAAQARHDSVTAAAVTAACSSVDLLRVPQPLESQQCMAFPDEVLTRSSIAAASSAANHVRNSTRSRAHTSYLPRPHNNHCTTGKPPPATKTPAKPRSTAHKHKQTRGKSAQNSVKSHNITHLWQKAETSRAATEPPYTQTSDGANTIQPTQPPSQPQPRSPKATPCNTAEPITAQPEVTPDSTSHMREGPEQPNPPSTHDDLLTAEQQNLTLYLQNVQGISGDGNTTRKAACKRAELKQMLQRASGNHPHLVVVTDHKYARTQDSLKRLLNGYQVHLNPAPSSATNKEPRYGVVVAVTQPLCEMGTVWAQYKTSPFTMKP